ncbi:hypothetical protein Ahy_B01g054306 isoform A [Arachis hypogaea]|uniref:Uncharacterized protein n=1 Tax=Arachis hypogaea TaxID=3818 RepID=A0A445ATP9_ARAHY|nr:hypothetical protein Ahy_B01g054306 isoform A [Arachis hypogaea]
MIWGIQRNRTKMICNSCGHLLRYIYNNDPPLTYTPGRCPGVISEVPEIILRCVSRDEATLAVAQKHKGKALDFWLETEDNNWIKRVKFHRQKS